MTFILFFALLTQAQTLKSAGPAEKDLPFTRLEEAELLEYFREMTIALSGLPEARLEELPPIYFASKSQIDQIVCPTDPKNCRNLAAFFDDISYRIVIDETLEISSNFQPYNYSFVIHELTHALQYLQGGPEIFKDCNTVYRTERDAYSVQDEYLKREGAFERLGPQFRFGFRCDEEETKEQYDKSMEVWKKRKDRKGHS